MAKIILESWREGFEKISLAKLQVDILGKSLARSKFKVDSLLDDKKVIINIDNLDIVYRFLNEVRKIGVSCKLITD